jgi:hypothetical protein
MPSTSRLSASLKRLLDSPRSAPVPPPPGLAAALRALRASAAERGVGAASWLTIAVRCPFFS